MRRDSSANVSAGGPGLSRGGAPASVEELARRALHDDGAAEALAEALGELSSAERGALFGVLAEALGDRFGSLVVRLIGTAGDATVARRLASEGASVERGHAFRAGDAVFLRAGGGAAVLEVAASRVTVHEQLETTELEARPLQPAVDEAARILWRHHRGALPAAARPFADLFDRPLRGGERNPPTPVDLRWRS